MAVRKKPVKRPAATRKAPAKKAPKRKAPGKKAPSKKAPKRKAPGNKAPAPRKAPGKKRAPAQAPGKKQAPVKAPRKKPAPAKVKAEAVEVGSRAPGFSLVNADGTVVSSAELSGTPYVLYFYPKDDTPGCTREACDFRDAQMAFQRAGVRVIGVSPDSTESHSRFKSKYRLPFALLADRDKDLVQAYGVWVKKNRYGREYMGVERSTFLVDEKGKVRRVWRGVRVPGHADAVLAAARELA
jgi:peroxiredoxin Q/BCP